jgi:hypothetical protein
MEGLTPELMRGLERFLTVLGGILAIYLGYRLFIVASIPQESSGKVRTKAFEFAISKVGPGVFFASFGAWVLYTAVTSQLSVNTEDEAGGSRVPMWVEDAIGPHPTEQFKAIVQRLPTDKDKEEALTFLKLRVQVPVRRFRHLTLD